MTETFKVTVPASAAPGTHTLSVTVSPAATGAPVAEASTTVAVPYPSMTAAYNNIGISDNSNAAAANYDGVGDSFSAQALAAGTPTALTPGQQVTIGGTTFTWPDVRGREPRTTSSPPARPSSCPASGPTSASLAQARTAPRAGRHVHYTDGSSQSFNLNMADWYANSPGRWQPAPDDDLKLERPRQPSSAPGERLLRLSAAGSRASRSRRSRCPSCTQRRRHHRHAHLRHGHWKRNPDDRARRTRRSPRPMTTPGSATTPTPPPADFDGTGDSFSAQALAAGTPTPLTAGRPGDVRRDDLHLADTAVGAPDNVIADGQIIDMSGSGTDLGFLGAGGSARRAGPAPSPIPTEHPEVQHHHGRLVQQRAGRRRPDRHHHLQLELLEQLAEPAPGEHLLRVGPARVGQDRQHPSRCRRSARSGTASTRCTSSRSRSGRVPRRVALHRRAPASSSTASEGRRITPGRGEPRPASTSSPRLA